MRHQRVPTLALGHQRSHGLAVRRRDFSRTQVRDHCSADKRMDKGQRGARRPATVLQQSVGSSREIAA